MIFELLK